MRNGKGGADLGTTTRPTLDSTVSERKPQRQLKLSREIGLRCDLPERTASEGNTRAIEQRCVEGVQRLRAELSLQRFLDHKVLEDRHIPVGLPRAAHVDGPAYVAECELRGG